MSSLFHRKSRRRHILPALRRVTLRSPTAAVQRLYPGTPTGQRSRRCGLCARAAQSGLSDNSAAALAYVTIIPAIIFLVMEPYNRKPFVRYHAMQCIGLHVLWLAVWVVLMVVGIMLAVVHLHLLVLLLWPICWIGLVILWLLCIVSAAQGKWFKLPIIGDFAKKQAGA